MIRSSLWPQAKLRAVNASEFARIFADTCRDSAETAKRNNHQLHPWARGEGFTARTACRSCGATAHVKVTAKTNEAGGRALTQVCTSVRH